ncbi:MAG: hypothetical protein Q4E09_01575 [Eubacteriales bacterium]|nr:hypothetical protein [Eubacteriales bacterium]
MTQATSELPRDIPDFSQLDFQLLPTADFAALTRELAQKFSRQEEAELTKEKLLLIHEQIQLRQSLVAYREIEEALGQEKTGPEPELKIAKEQLTDCLNESHSAKSLVYEAVATVPLESMEASPEDQDLASRAWRWRKFEQPVPAELFQREQELKQAISGLRPRIYRILARQGLSHLPQDQGSEEKREIFFQDLKQELADKAEERERLLLEIFAVRAEIAHYCSYQNYSTYHEARREERSFSREQERSFVRSYLQQFGPLRDEVNRLREQRFSRELSRWQDFFLISPKGQVPWNLKQDEAIERFNEALVDLTGHDDHILLSLLRQGYVSYLGEVNEELSSSTLLPSVPAAFLCLPLDSPYRGLAHSFYACGEALADLSSLLNYHVLGASSQDAYSKAISGYCFLALSEILAGEFYPSNTEYAYDLSWTERFLASFWSLATYELEHHLYSQEKISSARDIDELWRQQLAIYLPEINLELMKPEELRWSWHYALSLATEAYQTLAGPLGMVTVLAEQPRRHANSILSTKLNNYLITNPGSKILARLSAAGLEAPVYDKSIEAAAFALCDILEL